MRHHLADCVGLGLCDYETMTSKVAYVLATSMHRTRRLYCVECHNTVFGSKRSAICAQGVYFVHSTMPSVTCLRLSDVSVICRVTYFQFPIQACFSSMSVRQTAQRRIGLCNIEHCTLPKIWVGSFLVRGVQPRE